MSDEVIVIGGGAAGILAARRSAGRRSRCWKRRAEDYVMLKQDQFAEQAAKVRITPEERARKQSGKRKNRIAAAALAAALMPVSAGTALRLHYMAPVDARDTYPLAEIRDNQPFYADLVSVGSIAKEASAGAIRVYKKDPQDGRFLWRMTKHGGQVYLEAYMRMLQPPDKPMGLFYDSSLGSSESIHTKRITLPLKNLHWSDSLEDDSGRGMTWVTNVRPDRHVWEQW